MKQQGRYFLAIIPPSPIYEQVMELKTHFKVHYNCKAPLRSPAHITLQMPFLWPENKKDLMGDSLQSFARDQRTFSLQLDGFNCFESRVIYIDVLKSEALSSLQKSLVTYLKREHQIFNANYKDRGFHPHMTVAFRDLKKPLFYQAWAEFQDKAFAGDFAVSSFWLLKHDGRQWQPFQEIFLGY